MSIEIDFINYIKREFPQIMEGASNEEITSEVYRAMVGFNDFTDKLKNGMEHLASQTFSPVEIEELEEKLKFSPVTFPKDGEELFIPQEVMGISDELILKAYEEGQTCFERGDIEIASNIFNLLAFFNPKVEAFWIALAYTEEALERWEEAGMAYMMALEMGGDLANALPFAKCLYRTGREKEAEKVLVLARQEKKEADFQYDFENWKREDRG